MSMNGSTSAQIMRLTVFILKVQIKELWNKVVEADMRNQKTNNGDCFGSQ